MILYLDASALLKKYFQEVGSEDVISKWKETDGIVTSTVTYAEVMASIHRKRREASEDDKLFRGVMKSFQQDWNTFIQVAVTNDLNELIDRILLSHPLRGFDVIHLASALIVCENVSGKFLFACFDRRLNTAAHAEGLYTLPASPSQ
jgi:predicted nucleic acid-binding protein